jgi:peroxiredoxin
MRFSAIVIILIFCLTTIVSFGVCEDESRVDGSELVGKKIPDFKLYDYKRNPHSLSDYRGRIIILAFWHPGDENCEKALISLGGIYDSFSRSDLEVIAVDIHAKISGALMFIARNNLSYLFLEGVFSEAVEVYKVEGVPSMFLVDRQGIVRKFYAGFGENTESSLKKAITDILH